MKKLLKKLLFPFMLVLAIILVFEEWLWDALTKLTHFIAALPIFRALERWIEGLSPYPSLALFVLPPFVLVPFKFLALEFITHGRPFSGLAMIGLAKVVGTALFARLFAITRGKVLQIGWCAYLYTKVNTALEWARNWLRSMRAYQMVRKASERVKAWWRRLKVRR